MIWPPIYKRIAFESYYYFKSYGTLNAEFNWGTNGVVMKGLKCFHLYGTIWNNQKICWTQQVMNSGEIVYFFLLIDSLKCYGVPVFKLLNGKRLYLLKNAWSWTSTF